MKIDNCQGDITDVLAETKPLDNAHSALAMLYHEPIENHGFQPIAENILLAAVGNLPAHVPDFLSGFVRSFAPRATPQQLDAWRPLQQCFLFSQS